MDEPVAGWREPAAHLSHCDAPVAAAYMPVAQLEQADAPAEEYLPTTQVPEAAASPPAAQNVPARQLTHEVAPVLGW